MASNVIDKPAEANEDRLDMKVYASVLTEFIANAQSPLTPYRVSVNNNK